MKRTLKSVMALVFCVVMIAATASLAFAALGNVTNLKATNVTYNSATLTWTAASGADGYQVRPYTGGKYGTTVTLGKVTTYKATLTPGASYYFYVRSFEKKWSFSGYKYTYGAWVKTAAFKAVPAQVTGLKAVQSKNTVTLTWTKVPSITGYVVQQYKGGKYVNLKVLSSSYNTYTATGLTYGSTQYFRVVAYAKSGSKNIYGAYSSAVKLQIKTAAPTTIKVKNVTANSGYLYWSGSTGATGYQVYDYATKKVINAGSNKYLTIKSLKPGTTYNFRVRSYVKYGSSYVYSAYSTVLYSFTTAPAAITGVKIANVTDSTMDVSWTKATNAIGYQVWHKINGASAWTRAVVTTGLKGTVTALKANSKYAIAVRGYVKNEGVYSYGAWSTFQYPVTKMAAPVISSTGNTDTKLNLTWTAVDGASYYIVEKYDIKNYEWNAITDENGEAVKFTDRTYTDTTSNLTSKLYRVQAVAANGETGVVAKGTAVTPNGITITQDAYTATVTWGDMENNKTGTYTNMSYYDIYTMNPVKSTNFTWTYLAQIKSEDLDSYTFALTPGCVNSYMIYAKPADGSSTLKIVEFSVDAADFKIDNSDAGKNAQLLYFVNSINKTKLEQDTVTVKCTTTASMNLEKILIDGDIETGETDAMTILFKTIAGDGEITGEEIQKFIDLALKLNIISDEDVPEINTSESYTNEYTFTEGKATTEADKTVYLKRFVEPSATGDSLAYLYNRNDTSAWKNGFSSVAMAQYSDGRYKFTATLKQEKFGVSAGQTTSLYHPGFVSTIEGGSLSGSDNSVNDLSSVGATTIVAVINTDGTLDSLAIKSPFTTKFYEKVGETLSLGMQMNGTTASTYTFTR